MSLHLADMRYSLKQIAFEDDVSGPVIALAWQPMLVSCACSGF